MTCALRFLPEVEEDLIAGYRWYEEKAPGIGEDFLRSFFNRAAGIQRNPMLYPQVYRDFRRCLLRRFPYGIYFKMEGSDVIVIGVFHCARDPGSLGQRFRERVGH